jgi:hypothetical protein
MVTSDAPMTTGDSLETRLIAAVQKLLKSSAQENDDVLPIRKVMKIEGSGFHSEQVPDASQGIVGRDHRYIEGVFGPLFTEYRQPTLADARALVTYTRLVCSRTDWVIDPDRWHTFFPEAVRFIRTEIQKSTWTVPIVGIELDTTYSLAGDAILRPLTLAEREELAEERPLDGYRATAAFECVRYIEPHSVVNSLEMQAFFDRLRTAMWLFMGARVHFAPIRYVVLFHGGTAYFGYASPQWHQPAQTPTRIQGDHFATLWASIERGLSQPPRSLELALRRFKQMYEQPRIGDWVLDQFITLEALLNPDDSRELSYRIGLRLAHLLGASLEFRRAIFSTVNAAYGIRSAIAHGRKAGPNADKIIGTLDTYTRNALSTFLIRQSVKPAGTDVKAEICREMDDHILEQAGTSDRMVRKPPTRRRRGRRDRRGRTPRGRVSR